MSGTTSYKDELHVEVDQKYHFFRNESEISNESKGGYLRGKVILPKSFIDAMDAVLDISLVYGLDDMKVINEWKITPCLLYVKVSERGCPRHVLSNSDWMISFRKSSSGIDGFLGDGTPIPRGDVEMAFSSGDGRIIQLGKSGLKLSVIKASQKATARVDQGKQSLEGVLRSRLSWINEGRVEEDRLKQLVGKFNASRRNGDPKAMHTVRLHVIFRAFDRQRESIRLEMSSNLILDSNSKFTREILIVGTTNCRLCENGGDVHLQMGREVKTESLRGKLWAKTVGENNQNKRILMDNLKMDRNRVIIRQLPEHWLDGITHDEDEDYKKVWLSLCRPETACHSNKAVMLKVFAHTATNCICCQESAEPMSAVNF